MKTVNLLFFVKLLGEYERKNVPLPCILHECAPAPQSDDRPTGCKEKTRLTEQCLTTTKTSTAD